MVLNLPPATVGSDCNLFIMFLNLPPLDRRGKGEVQHIFTVSEPPSRVLWARDAARIYMISESTSRRLMNIDAVCFYGCRTYLQGTVVQGCNLIIRFPNLPPGDCWLEVQHVYKVCVPPFRGLSARGAGC